MLNSRLRFKTLLCKTHSFILREFFCLSAQFLGNNSLFYSIIILWVSYICSFILFCNFTKFEAYSVAHMEYLEKLLVLLYNDYAFVKPDAAFIC